MDSQIRNLALSSGRERTGDSLSGSHSAPSAHGETFAFDPATVPHDEAAATEHLAAILGRAAALTTPTARNQAWVALANFVTGEASQGAPVAARAMPAAARAMVEAYLRHNIFDRIDGLELQLDRSVIAPMVQQLPPLFEQAKRFASRGPARMRLDSLTTDADAKLRYLRDAQPRGASLAPAPARPTNVVAHYPVRQAAQTAHEQALLAQFATLGTEPAEKLAVGTLPQAERWQQQYGPQALQASYLRSLVDPRKIYRIGKTTDNGGFSKIRSYVDADGNAGKMRVLHLKPQRNGWGARRHITPIVPESLKRELESMRAAGSPLAAGGMMHVVHGENPTLIKLYMPMPDLGVDTFYAAEQLAHYPDKLAVVAAVRSVATQVLDRLVPLHANHYVHRDLKLENVMLRPGGNVELIDFGLARKAPFAALDEQDGTPGYIAPENYNRSGIYVDGRIDVWGLANVMVNLLDFGRAGLLPLTAAAPGALGAMSTQEVTVSLADHDAAATLTEAWYKNIFKPGARLTAEQAEDDGLRALDKAARQLRRLDPAFAKLLFSNVYRVPRGRRMPSALLQQALAELPPLSGDVARDKVLATQALDYAYALAKAAHAVDVAKKAGLAPQVDLSQLPAQI